MMDKKNFFNLYKIFFAGLALFVLFGSTVVIASPDLENDIKKDLSIYINHLNNGNISGYYDIYNTRKLSEIEKGLFYEKIKNTTNVIEKEKEFFNKFKLKVQITNVEILNRINNNLYLCNLNVKYQARESVDTTKTIKKEEGFIVKILNIEKDKYKILLPFNSMDKDFSETEVFRSIQNIYKENKANLIAQKRLEVESEKSNEVNDVDTDKTNSNIDDSTINNNIDDDTEGNNTNNTNDVNTKEDNNKNE